MFIEDRYEVQIDDTDCIFDFVSEGKKGKIHKVIRFSKTNLKDTYNLGFGDYDESIGVVNDKVVTDNGDSEKVLATVASTVYVFTALNPKVYIILTGNTPARNRLYRIGISKYLDKITEDFDVQGLQNGVWRTFMSNGNYKSFLIRRKLYINDYQ